MRLTPLALVAVLGLGLTACSDDEPEPAAAQPGDGASSKVLQPGLPGEDNETLDPDATVSAPAANEADVVFMEMMVPHHTQALEMSALARTRAEDAQVQAIARRIEGAQGPEIVSMTQWLQSRGLDVPESMADAMGMPEDHAESMPMAMHGMLSPEEMDELAAARGAEFDRLFVAGMIRHHQGAVDMARSEMEAGSDTLALELASDVAAGQAAEIRRLADIRRRF